MRVLPLAAVALLGAAPLTLPAQPPRTGAQVYATCAACHMPTGLGLPNAFPPLAGSEWVTGRIEVPIALVLHGMQGEVTVKGAKYNSVMTPWGAMFSDQEVANVVTYIRSQWGNRASAATAADVARVRAATRSQKAPLTAAEVKKLYP
jgi:mono/diheme cytochrome c family protein